MRRSIAVVLAAVAFASCAVQRPVDPTSVMPTCDVRFRAPAGFEPLESFREEYPDHVGVRYGFGDGRGRELHVFAGIPGEFGEGLPSAGDLALRDGGAGTLVGSGSVWVVVWDRHDRCDPRAALGNGFGRRGFLRALVDAGVVQA